MRNYPPLDDELGELLQSLCNGCLDGDARGRLKEILEASDEACRRYVEMVHLSVGISYLSGIGAPSQERRGVASAPPCETLSTPGAPLGDSPDSGTWLGLLFQPRTLFLAAAVVFIGVVGGLLLERPGPGERPVLARPVGASPPPGEAKSAAAEVPPAFVARIVKASADLRWGEAMAPVEFLVRVRSGDQIRLAAGLVELEFYSGAHIILHGPAVFTPTGVAAGHLESGRLTGEVSDGNFRLMTPTAEVIDLGTAFGVAADAAVGTDVVVFDGRVQVVSLNDGGQPGTPLDMGEGMAARFRADGKTEYGVKTDIGQFQRRVSAGKKSANDNEISLIDVIAGGDGQGARLAGAIEPLSGSKDFGQHDLPRRFVSQRTDDKFHPISWNLLIDGVFVPSRGGQQVAITSTGLKADLPAGSGKTWGPLWARSKDNLIQFDSSPQGDFWGDSVLAHREDGTLQALVERLKHSQHGLVGIHSNVGITFNLQAMQLVHRRAPTEFRGSVANIENSRDIPPPKKLKHPLTASFHVFVDGKLRYQRLAFGLDDADEQFSVPLTSTDRFLTVVSTDEQSIDYDHVVLIDPVIALPTATDDTKTESQGD